MATSLASTESGSMPSASGRASSGIPAGRWIWRCVSLLACLGLWQIAAQYKASLGFVTMANVPAPTDVAPGTTRCGSPGNVQINTAPTQTGPYLPYDCDPQYGAHCDDGAKLHYASHWV